MELISCALLIDLNGLPNNPKVKASNIVDLPVPLSPLTPMATHYHIRNGAKLLGHNPTTQNFEYKL